MHMYVYAVSVLSIINNSGNFAILIFSIREIVFNTEYSILLILKIVGTTEYFDKIHNNSNYQFLELLLLCISHTK